MVEDKNASVVERPFESQTANQTGRRGFHLIFSNCKYVREATDQRNSPIIVYMIRIILVKKWNQYAFKQQLEKTHEFKITLKMSRSL